MIHILCYFPLVMFNISYQCCVPQSCTYNMVLLQKKPADSKPAKDKSKNIMRDVRIRKLCLNICVGESGDRLTRAAKVSLCPL